MEETPVELPVVGIVLNVVTNLVFLIALVRALQHDDHVRAFLAGHIVVWSSFWHLCYPANGYCVLSRHVLQGADYVGALFLPFSLLLLLAPFGPVRPVAGFGVTARRDRRYVELWLHLGAVAALVMSGAERGKFWPLPWAVYVPLMGVAGLTVVISWLTVWRRYGHAPSYDRVDLVVGLGLGTVGMALFLGVEDYWLPRYWSWTVHAPWHVLGALGFFYLLEARSRTHHGLAQFHAWPKVPHNREQETADPYNIAGHSLRQYVEAPVAAPPFRWVDSSSSAD